MLSYLCFVCTQPGDMGKLNGGVECLDMHGCNPLSAYSWSEECLPGGRQQGSRRQAYREVFTAFPGGHCSGLMCYESERRVTLDTHEGLSTCLLTLR